MVWMMESRIINWMRCWLFRDWCCGAAHSCERSQPLHLETGHPSASHWPTWLVLNYLKKMMIMKMYYSDKGSKSTYSGKLTLGISMGRDNMREAAALDSRTWDWYQWHEPNYPFMRFPNADLPLAVWMAMPDWFHRSRVTLYVTQLILKEGGGLK